MSTFGQPRALVLVNGAVMPGLESFQVDNNSFYQADTFRVSFALSRTGQALDWWSRQAEVELEICAGYPSNPEAFGKADLDSLIVGRVDDLEIDPFGNRVTASGRDYTSVFLDTKTYEKFANLRASEIAERLAAGHGLKSAAVRTQDKVGTFYQLDQVNMSSERPEWDLLTYLAQEEGYQVYVRGTTLHFEPRDQAAGAPFVFTYRPLDDAQAFVSSNALRLEFSRSLTVAKDITVQVRSNNHKQKRTHVATAERRRVRNAVTRRAMQLAEPPQIYSYQFPNLTPQQAQDRANSILADLTRHEMNLSAEAPADAALTARTPIDVQGTGSAFDQRYWPSSIVRTYSADEGYRMSVTAKNHSPETTVLP